MKKLDNFSGVFFVLIFFRGIRDFIFILIIFHFNFDFSFFIIFVGNGCEVVGL